MGKVCHCFHCHMHAALLLKVFGVTPRDVKLCQHHAKVETVLKTWQTWDRGRVVVSKQTE